MESAGAAKPVVVVAVVRPVVVAVGTPEVVVVVVVPRPAPHNAVVALSQSPKQPYLF